MRKNKEFSLRGGPRNKCNERRQTHNSNKNKRRKDRVAKDDALQGDFRIRIPGREDMIRALDFIFGADLRELFADSPEHLLHKAFFHDFQNGGFEYKVDETIVSALRYDEILSEFNLSVKRKNLVFRKSLFYDLIWGTPIDLERTISEIVRVSTMVDDWKKSKDTLKYLLETKFLSDENAQQMKKSHETVEKFVNSLTDIATKRVHYWKTMKLEQCADDSLEPSSPSDPSFPCESIPNRAALDEEQESLKENYRVLETEESQLLGKLYYREIKMSSMSKNSSTLPDRILELQEKIKCHESYLASLRAKTDEINSQVLHLEVMISSKLATLWDFQQSYYMENRFTKYGRFVDHLKPNRFCNMLRVILGDNIMHANLCDKMETAIALSKQLKKIKYEGRETFIPFENYSSKLKDLLLASGEEGTAINNVQELQIFLCKLKQYEFIARVPILIGQRFTFSLQEGENIADDVIYPIDGIYLSSDGLLSYTSNQKTNTETVESVSEQVSELLILQDSKYQELSDLIFRRFETLRKMNELENDVSYMTIDSSKKQISSSYMERSKSPPEFIYHSYASFFKEHDEKMENIQKELEESDDFSFTSQAQSRNISPNVQKQRELEDSLTRVSNALRRITEEKMQVKQKLLSSERELRLLNASFNNTTEVPRIRRFFALTQPKLTGGFYYEKELENLRILISKDEMDEFEGWKEWRKERINSLVKDMREIDNLLKATKKNLDNISEMRKREFSPLLQHCNRHLTTTFISMMDLSLPFLHLAVNQSECGVQLQTSLAEGEVKIIEISNLNTFLKFIAGLCLFLELVVFENIPVLILDDVEEFLPGRNSTFEGVVGDDVLTRLLSSEKNITFQMLTRIGQYLGFFIKKGTLRSSVRKNKSEAGNKGPKQIIYFASQDLIHFAEHSLWIRSNILPDEYITEELNSYSVLEEIILP